MRWLFLGALLAVAAPVFAGTVTFNFGGSTNTLITPANQDAQLSRLLARENSVRASRVPPASAFTMEQFARDIFIKAVQDRKGDADTFETVDFCTAYSTLTTAQKNNIVSLGGNNSPCP